MPLPVLGWWTAFSAQRSSRRRHQCESASSTCASDQIHESADFLQLHRTMPIAVAHRPTHREPIGAGVGDASISGRPSEPAMAIFTSAAWQRYAHRSLDPWPRQPIEQGRRCLPRMPASLQWVSSKSTLPGWAGGREDLVDGRARRTASRHTRSAPPGADAARAIGPRRPASRTARAARRAPVSHRLNRYRENHRSRRPIPRVPLDRRPAADRIDGCPDHAVISPAQRGARVP